MALEYMETEQEFKDRVVHINRVAKVVKGGKRFSFAALVVVGDGRGKVGIGHGKANEVPEAIRKAVEKAKSTMVKVALSEGGTIPHEQLGECGAAKVFLRPAAPGTGVIAGGPVRAVVEVAGISNILTKSLGTNNPQNVVKAAYDALLKLEGKEEVSFRRGKSQEEI